ncbi:MAG: hypothetical protein ACYSTI_13980 [Planctomycetota bacterium]|jgi:hypothetical protein
MDKRGPGRPPKERPLEEESRFVEPERKAVPAPKAFPKDGRIKCKVFNLKAPGEDCRGKVNKLNFSVQHGEEVSLHPSMIEALQNAVVETEEWKDLGNSWEKRPVSKPRFMVQVLGAA